MPAAPTQTLFATPDFKLDNKMLSHLAHLCTPDLPANATSLIGDFAFSEICLSDFESGRFIDVVHALRNPHNSEFMANVVAKLKQQGAEKKNKVMIQFAESIEAEYARICKIFFLRSRCIEVSRASTNQVIGRIISFPDQISDDYGNNLEVRGEKGMNPIKVVRGEKAVQTRVKTAFLGHGQGSTMAQICSCMYDSQCVTFDSTFVSEILVQSFFRNEVPENFMMEPRQTPASEWNVMNISVELVEKRFASAVQAGLAVAKKEAEEQAVRKAEEAERKKQEDRAKGKPQEPPKKKEDEGPNPVECAAEYFPKRVSYRIAALIPDGPATRFTQTGKFPASAISKILAEYMTSVGPSQYPYAAPPPPPADADEDDE